MTQETTQQLKAFAKTVGRELSALGYTNIQHTHLLQALSKASGFESWNAIRATATAASPTAPVTREPTRPYPQMYVSATYNANGRTVEVVRWEDPVANIGDHFYVYDADSFQCLTPTKELAFPPYGEVPDYEAIVTLLDQLEHAHRCPVCGFVAEDDGDTLHQEHDGCPREGCPGELVPFLND